MIMDAVCKEALHIFRAAVNAVKPEALIQRTMKFSPATSSLHIKESQYEVSHNVYVVGFGKAVLGMAVAVESVLGDHLVSGVISIPKGIQNRMAMDGQKLLKADSKIQVFEGATNNLPDADAMEAAFTITNLVSSLRETDLLLVLVSGGGSALLPAPLPSISLCDKLQVIKLLSEQGATIQELNSVRRRMSVLKGGGLAKLARPAQVVGLILSDIIGDPTHLVASGPTVHNVDPRILPLEILKKYGLMDKVPPQVVTCLDDLSKHAPSVSQDFKHVQNHLLGNNSDATTAAKRVADELGYVSKVVSLELQGEAREVGYNLATMANALLNKDIPKLKESMNLLNLKEKRKQYLLNSATNSHFKNDGLCLIFAGETVVKVEGKGIGGRNQELALAASIKMEQNFVEGNTVVLLSAGTDGIDGPTPAAGAIATPFVVGEAKQSGLYPMKYLDDNDSYSFYAKVANGQWHVITGHTGTNVMDLVLILLKQKLN